MTTTPADQNPAEPSPAASQPADPNSADKKLPAALLAIFLGWIGAHKFYLGYTKQGVIQIVLSMFCIGWLLGVIEGLIYITQSDEEFVTTYVTGRKGWF